MADWIFTVSKLFTYEVDTNACIGQDKDYRQRVYLLYDGIHYDPLALTYDTALPEDADVTKFDPDDDTVAEKVKELCNREKGVSFLVFIVVLICVP